MKKRRFFHCEGPSALAFVFKSISLALFVAGAVTALSGCFSRETTVLNKTALSINGTDISTKQFAERLALKLKGFDSLSAKDEAVLSRAKDQTILDFVIENLIKEYAGKNSVAVDKKEIDTFVAQVQSKYPDEFAFRRALAEENLPLESWRESISLELLKKKVFQKVIDATVDKAEPKDSELKAYYDANVAQFSRPARVRLKQIVLEKEDDAIRINTELEQGGNIESLAKKFSIAPEASNNGDTGWIEKGTLEIFDQAFKMPIGARSKILKSPYGWHIYVVSKKEPEQRLNFEGAKARIRSTLIEQRNQKIFSNWLESQVKASKVKRNDAVLQAIKVTTRGT